MIRYKKLKNFSDISKEIEAAESKITVQGNVTLDISIPGQGQQQETNPAAVAIKRAKDLLEVVGNILNGIKYRNLSIHKRRELKNNLRSFREVVGLVIKSNGRITIIEDDKREGWYIYSSSGERVFTIYAKVQGQTIYYAYKSSDICSIFKEYGGTEQQSKVKYSVRKCISLLKKYRDEIMVDGSSYDDGRSVGDALDILEACKKDRKKWNYCSESNKSIKDDSVRKDILNAIVAKVVNDDTLPQQRRKTLFRCVKVFRNKKVLRDIAEEYDLPISQIDVKILNNCYKNNGNSGFTIKELQDYISINSKKVAEDIKTHSAEEIKTISTDLIERVNVFLAAYNHQKRFKDKEERSKKEEFTDITRDYATIKDIKNVGQYYDNVIHERTFALTPIIKLANDGIRKRKRRIRGLFLGVDLVVIIIAVALGFCSPLIKFNHLDRSFAYSTQSAEFEFKKFDDSGVEIISAIPTSDDGLVEFPTQVTLDNAGLFREDVVAIGANVFGDENTQNLRSIFIPKSIINIDKDAFAKLNNVTFYCEIAERPEGYEAGWSGENTVIWNWQSVVEIQTVVRDGMNFALQTNTAIFLGLEGAGKESLEIPSEITVGGKDYKVTQIAENALAAENDSEKFAQISNITVPDSVTSIGNAAFGGCSNLTSITLPFVGGKINGTENTHFGYIFGAEDYGNNLQCVPGSLETVIIENNRADANISIGANVFSGCGKLKNITFGDAVTKFASSALVDCSEIKTLTLPFLGKTSKEGSNLGYLFENGSNASIPEELRSVTITGDDPIVEEAFKNCEHLKKISLSGAQFIGDEAFAGCSNLAMVNVSNDIKGIGNNVFLGCGNLTYNEYNEANYIGNEGRPYLILVKSKNVVQLTINEDTRIIANNAFEGCTGITEMVIPDNVQSIGLGAFAGCNGIAKITIPFVGATVDGAKNTFLGHIFGAETYLQDSKIPASLKEVEITGTNIGHHAFYNCQNLTSIYISDSVTEIGGYAFSGCSAEIVWGENPKIKSIGSWSFSNYSGAELIIPNDVNTIEFSAISNCSSETIILSNSVTTIEDQAFWKCSNLTSLVIGDVSQLEFIGESAFYGCEKLASILLPDNLKTLEPLAFANCVNLIRIIIPCSVTSIGQQVFYGCNGLKNIVVDEENSTYYSINNCIIETATKTLIAGCSNSVIPIDGSVTSIGGGAFSGYQGIESVFIPDSVTSIGDGAFSGSSIASINIPASVTSIGAGAFFGCRNLTHVTIPNSITNIKDITFHSCLSLTEIILPASVTSIGDDVFWGCGNLTIFCEVENQPSGWSDDWNSGCDVVWDFKYEYEVRNNAVYLTKYNGTETDIILPSKIDGLPVVDFGTTFEETNITSIVIPDSVLNIEEGAFSGCNGLTSITIPDSVTSIGINAFNNCSRLTSITIPNSVMLIGWGVLQNCNSLERLSIPFIGEQEEMPNQKLNFIFGSDSYDGVPNSLKEVVITREIDIKGFYNCRGITSVIIKSNARSIEEGAFMGCEELENVVLPNSITSIGESAFSGCYSLQNIAIPSTVSNIGSYAFAYCRELESIAVPNSVVSIGLGVFRGCNELEKINIPFVGAELNETQNTHFGYIFGAGGNSENHYYVPSSLKEVVLTGGNDIDDWAFYGCASLESVSIPNSITSIGAWAFFECSELINIIIPDSVTSIGTDAFVNCTSLSNIVVSNNVTSIPHALFYGCSQLKSLTIPFVGATLNGVENSYFGYLFGADNSVDNEMYVPNSLKQVVITGGANIGSEAFYYCSSLTSIIIPHSVTNIGSAAFTGCSGLISITIPSSVTSIGEYAFYGCNLIYCEAITKPTGWHDNWIGGRGCPVVWDCNNNDSDANGNIYYISDAGIIYALNNSCASVIMGQSGALSGSLIVYEKLIYKDVKYTVTYINESAFTACVYLDEVVIGDGIIIIGRYAFYNCFRMTSILIGNNIKSIGDWAFAYCSNLESIKFEGTMEQWQAISKGSFWMSDTGDFTIICTDGELDKNGRQIR